MKIAILGALDREVALLRNEMTITQEQTALGTRFICGTLCGVEVVLACCGVGKVNAALCATYLLTVLQCDAILHIGIAGATGDGLKTLDVVLSKELCFHDQDAVMLKYFPKCQFFQADEHLLAMCEKVCQQPGILKGKCRVGRIATGDKYVTDNVTRAKIIETYAPDCVEMEGAATAHVAFAVGKPFLVIRTMSDCANDDTPVTYDNFIELAADQSARIVLALLKAMA